MSNVWDDGTCHATDTWWPIHWAWLESQFLPNKDLGAWSGGQLMPGHQIFEGCLWSYDLTCLWELLIPLARSHFQDWNLESHVSANYISNQWISYMWNGTTSLPCWNHAGDILMQPGVTFPSGLRLKFEWSVLQWHILLVVTLWLNGSDMDVAALHISFYISMSVKTAI